MPASRAPPPANINAACMYTWSVLRCQSRAARVMLHVTLGGDAAAVTASVAAVLLCCVRPDLGGTAGRERGGGRCSGCGLHAIANEYCRPATAHVTQHQQQPRRRQRLRHPWQRHCSFRRTRPAPRPGINPHLLTLCAMAHPDERTILAARSRERCRGRGIDTARHSCGPSPCMSASEQAPIFLFAWSGSCRRPCALPAIHCPPPPPHPRFPHAHSPAACCMLAN